MPSTITNEKLELLKKKVTAKVGFEILKHGDVLNLAEQINNKISTQTIKRIFSLIKSTSKPQLHTLDTLSCFVGYNTWQSFVKSSTIGDTLPNFNEINQEKLRHFYEIESEKVWDNYYFSSKKQAEETYHLVNNTNDIKIYKSLAKNSNAQQALFEFFPDLNSLAGNFKHGLLAYLKVKKNNEAQIYGYTLLALGAYLNQDHASFNHYFNALTKVPEDYNIHPTVIGRRCCIQLFNAVVNENDDTDLLNRIKELFNEQKWPITIPNAQFVIIEHLILAKKHKMAYELFKTYNFYSKGFLEGNSSKIYFSALKTFESLLLVLNGDVSKSKTIYETIDITTLDFNFRDYYACFYYWLESYHGDKVKAKNELEIAISKTNYSLFRQLIIIEI